MDPVCWPMLMEQKGKLKKDNIFLHDFQPSFTCSHTVNQLLNLEQMLASRVVFLFFLKLKPIEPASSHPLLIVAYASSVIPWGLSLQLGVFLNSAQS
jgi:hypothetical protein